MSDDNHSILVNGNQVWFQGDIDFLSIHKLMFEISKQPSNVQLFFTSVGGYVDAGLAFYDFLNHNQSRVTVVGHSCVASAATYWLFSKCKTYLFPSTEMMFHSQRVGFSDRCEALEGATFSYQARVKLIKNIYESKGFSCDWENKTLYFYADDFVHRNIVDGLWN